MNEKRGHWYLITGIVIGAALGLAYAWLVQPVQYTNTAPDSLGDQYKEHYRSMIAAAYRSNGDLVRAKARLELLKDANPYQTLSEQAQKSLAAGKTFEEVRALGMLAAALQNPPSNQPTPNPVTVTPGTESQATPSTLTTPLTLENTPEKETSEPTATSLAPQVNSPPTSTLLPTITPTSTAIAPFVLSNKEQSCDASFGKGLIQVFALDSNREPVPGIEIVITWEGGEDHFYTGLKPEVGLGYADFNMSPGITYTLHLATGGQPISGLVASECEASNGEHYLGNWILEFVQP
jgi:hypothetical protein